MLVFCNLVSVRRLSDVYIIQTFGSTYEEKLCVSIYEHKNWGHNYLYYVAALISSIFMEIRVSFTKIWNFVLMAVVWGAFMVKSTEC